MIALKSLIALLVQYLIISSASQLNPSVFQTLNGMDMPGVTENRGFKFTFNATESTLVSVLPYNSTYNFQVEDLSQGAVLTTIVLHIGLEQVTLRGRFKSTFSLPSLSTSPNKSTSATFVNNGKFNLNLREVHLTFGIDYKKSSQGVKLSYKSCSPLVDEVYIGFYEVEDTLESAPVPLLAALMPLVSKTEYQQMFCNAMNEVMSSSNPLITKAIKDRINNFAPPSAPIKKSG